MFWKSLAVILILIAGWIVYSFLQFRSEIHQVYVAPDPYTISTPDADLTLVEFIDYSCAACQQMNPILLTAIQKDGKIRYIPRPLVSKDPMTREVILFLYASARQEAFPQVHNKIFELWPIENINVLMDYAASIGLDTIQIEKDMKNPHVLQALELNQSYYDLWGFQAVPTILIATKFMGTKAIYVPREQMATVDEFLQKFKESRGWF